MSKTVEEWKPVVGYEGLYEVSDWGNVRSVDRTVEYYNVAKKATSIKVCNSKKIKPHISNNYYRLELNKNGKGEKKLVHRLVAEAFIPNPENNPVVGHNDCNSLNNYAFNLYWCTQEENNKHPITRQRRSNSLVGHIVSEETKNKLRSANKGKHFSPETEFKKLGLTSPS